MNTKAYVIPDPKKEPVKCIVLAYKVTKGVAHDDRNWDAVHFSRTSKAAKTLFEICGGLREADACLVDIAKRFNDKELFWTLETIVKHSHEWIAKKRGTPHANADTHRSRLFKALSERGRSEKIDGLHKTGESLPDSVRMLAHFAEGDKETSL